MGTLVDGMYMEWCTGVDQLPDFDPTFVEDSNIAIRQIYFTKETIDAHGDELDAYFMNTNAKGCMLVLYRSKSGLLEVTEITGYRSGNFGGS